MKEEKCDGYQSKENRNLLIEEEFSQGKWLDKQIENLTIEEKIQCLLVTSPEIKRLELPAFQIGGEAAHGVEARHDQDCTHTPIKTTTFTQPIGMSATWDTNLIERVGEAVGTEARVVFLKDGDIGLSRWAPTVDMERDPRWGRCEEGYGEDPYLTGKMASAYIQGIQGKDPFYLRCATTLKHFYGNNTENGRTFSSSSIDVRNKYEYYQEPFRRCIIEGRAESLMTSYNEINGIPAIVNPEVKNLVKDQWGLKGHVVCDMFDFQQTVTEHYYTKTHAETLALALQAGVDCFNDEKEVVLSAAREALQKGLITEADINLAIKHTFLTKLRLGIYNDSGTSPYDKVDDSQLNSVEHRELSLEVSKKAIVLLKNENKMLPLPRQTQNTIAVIGPLADVWRKDWYSGIPPYTITPYVGIKKEFKDAKVVLSDGIDRIKIRISQYWLALDEDGTCFLGTKEQAEVFELEDWGENKHTLRAVSIQKYLSANMESGQILADKSEVFSWFVEEVFFFYWINPSETEKPSNFTMETIHHQTIYAEAGVGLCFEKDPSVNDKNPDLSAVTMDSRKYFTEFIIEMVSDGIEEAVSCAANADQVIAVLGCHPIISAKEEVDRTTINLPVRQQELLERIKRANPAIILVLVTNYPYAINWAQDNISAILTTASGSQELGTAIAKVISGSTSPAGRLNMTWYQSDSQLPPIEEYDIIRVNRTYQYFGGPVLYSFGFGLSYTAFQYRNLTVQKEEKGLSITFLVKNTGSYDSDEVAQLYFSQLYSRTVRPIKQLKGFQRVFIKKGEEKELRFYLPYEELQYYDVVTGAPVLEESAYKIQIGASSADIKLEETVYINSVVIPARDMTKQVLCDHYDDYENIYLHLGHDGKSCILPKAKRESRTKTQGKAIYQDVIFHFLPKEIILDIKAEEAGTIDIGFGQAILATLEVDLMNAFAEVTVSLKEKGISLEENNSLWIQITGKIRVVQFRFR